MIPIDHKLDDRLRELAGEFVESLAADAGVKELANNQIRKFWEILKAAKDANVAWNLAIHQHRKAKKEFSNLNARRKPNKNSEKKLEKLERQKETARAKMDFWQKVASIAKRREFVEQLGLADTLSAKQVLALQIVFAECLYSELLYCKFQSPNHKEKKSP